LGATENSFFTLSTSSCPASPFKWASRAMEVLIGIALKTVSNYLDHINPTTIDDAFKPEANS
jgi:hypothetical protein